MRFYSLGIAVLGLAAGAASVALIPSRLLFSVAATSDGGAEAGLTGERWACPMMDFIGSKPGDCPVCGMKMTKVTAGELTREQQRRMGVQLTRIATGPAVATVRAYGTVRYDDRTLQVLLPRVAGRIVKRHEAALHAGTLVQPGAPVVDLYSPEVFAAQGELAAAVKLGDASAVRALTERFDRWNLSAVARAVVAGGAPVDTVTVTSPFSGRVVLALPGEGDSAGMSAARLPGVGQEVMADTPLLRLVDPHAFMLVLQVPEPRAHWLREGQAVRIASDDRGPLPEVEARLSWLAPELNAELRSREVHVHLRDPSGRLLAGSLIEARIDAALNARFEAADSARPEARDTFALVPKTAVLSTGVRHVAWRVAERQRDGRLRFELVPLALGPRLEDAAGNDVFVVRAGLKEGDEVATQGAFLIDSQAQLAGTASLLFPQGATAPAASASGHAH